MQSRTYKTQKIHYDTYIKIKYIYDGVNVIFCSSTTRLDNTDRLFVNMKYVAAYGFLVNNTYLFGAKSKFIQATDLSCAIREIYQRCFATFICIFHIVAAMEWLIYLRINDSVLVKTLFNWRDS